jgi:hypothetical protein
MISRLANRAAAASAAAIAASRRAWESTGLAAGTGSDWPVLSDSHEPWVKSMAQASPSPAAAVRRAGFW